MLLCSDFGRGGKAEPRVLGQDQLPLTAPATEDAATPRRQGNVAELLSASAPQFTG